MSDGVPDDELPDDLTDRAAERLLAAAAPDRPAVLAALQQEHPRHAAALRQLWCDLCGAEDLLGTSFPRSPDEPLQTIGGHRVVRRLGEGAFGTVYLCEQTTPVQRLVAVKVLRPGAGDERTLRRFGAERQLLASLNHPSITQVFDAGALPDGRPYFVMEYVDGAPLRAYCEARELPCRDRLRLFANLCRGVAHAHGRQIVHRDLKPANVLVVDTDQGPMPKIIDFGIAKAVAPARDGGGPRTDAGRVIGTPGYMSPEQAAGHNDAVDERADVFALGVMLYELLTDALPWPRGAAATDTDVVRPSARVTGSTDGSLAPTPVQRRSRAAELRGDLDWITLKALARERTERYPTVTALLADIERHLRGEPVSVGPPSLRYRLRKYVGRHRSQVLVAGGALVVLTAGLLGALAYGAAARAEAAAAKQAAAASAADFRAVLEHLVARANDPRLRDDPASDGTRQALLQEALAFHDRFLVSRPTDHDLRVGRCRALLSIAQVHLQLGETQHALTMAGEAVDEAKVLAAAVPDDIAMRGLLGEALRKHGRAFALAGNHAAARPLLAAAIDHLAACAAADPAAYGRSHAGVLREAADTAAERSGPAALDGMRRSLAVLAALRRDHDQPELADDHAQTCIALATRLNEARQYQAAQHLLTEAAADLPSLTKDLHRLTTTIRRQQGFCAWALDDRPTAIRHMQAAATAAEAWVAEQPQRVQPNDYLVRVLRDLGTFHNYVGDFAASSLAFRRAIAAAEAGVQRFAGNPSQLATSCRVLREYAHVLWDRYRAEDLAEAAECAARANAANDRIDPTVDVERQARWVLSLLQAGIAEARGEDVDRLWQAVETELPDDALARRSADAGQLALAGVGLARWHGRHHRAAQATAYLELAGEAIERDKPTSDRLLVDVGWLQAQLAIARGDATAAAAAADGILAARTTWFAQQRAGDCLHAAWRLLAGRPGPAAGAAARAYRDRALEHYGRVMDSLQADVRSQPADPWYVSHWGFSCTRAAELTIAAGDADRAWRLLTNALPKLAAVRAAAHRDQWDTAAFGDGVALHGWLTGATLAGWLPITSRR